MNVCVKIIPPLEEVRESTHSTGRYVFFPSTNYHWVLKSRHRSFYTSILVNKGLTEFYQYSAAPSKLRGLSTGHPWLPPVTEIQPDTVCLSRWIIPPPRKVLPKKEEKNPTGIWSRLQRVR